MSNTVLSFLLAWKVANFYCILNIFIKDKTILHGCHMQTAMSATHKELFKFSFRPSWPKIGVRSLQQVELHRFLKAFVYMSLLLVRRLAVRLSVSSACLHLGAVNLRLKLQCKNKWRITCASLAKFPFIWLAFFCFIVASR